MPDHGTQRLEDLGPTGPHLAPLYPELPWALQDVRLLKCTFDIDADVVRRLLPEPLTRPVSPFGVFFVQDVADSPLGPFRLAAQFIGCRYLTYVRAYVLQAVIDGPTALAAFREVWSYPAKPGSVTLEDTGSQLKCTVDTLAGDRLATCTLLDPQPANTAKVLLEAELTVRVPARFRVDDPVEATLVQINRTGTLRDARRGPFTVEFSTPNDAYPWAELPSANHIIGVSLCGDLQLAPTQYELPYHSQELPVWEDLVVTGGSDR